MNQRTIIPILIIEVLLVLATIIMIPMTSSEEAILCTAKGMVYIDGVPASVGEAEVLLVFTDPDET